MNRSRHRFSRVSATVITACCNYIEIMVRTQIQLTEEQARKVRRIAQEEGVSMAAIIRRWIDRGLAERHPARTELWERALAEIGRFEDPSGATDVAANHDRYLDEIYG